MHFSLYGHPLTRDQGASQNMYLLHKHQFPSVYCPFFNDAMLSYLSRPDHNPANLPLLITSSYLSESLGSDMVFLGVFLKTCFGTGFVFKYESVSLKKTTTIKQNLIMYFLDTITLHVTIEPACVFLVFFLSNDSIKANLTTHKHSYDDRCVFSKKYFVCLTFCAGAVKLFDQTLL